MDAEFQSGAPAVDGGAFTFEIDGGRVSVALHEDGSVRIESPRGSEIATTWQTDLLAEDLIDHGLRPSDARRVATALGDLRASPNRSE
jgi:hypothetical protein